MTEKLFEDFSPVTTDQWLEVVKKDLKGADFDKRLVSETLDGIKLRPFYRAENVTERADSVVRGYVRQAGKPAFREEIRELDLAAANRHALRSLERGAFELSVLTYPTGVPVRTFQDMTTFTEGIWIDSVPIHWMSGPFTRPMIGLITSEASRRGMDSQALQGSVEFDPIMDRCAGWTPGPVSVWKGEFNACLDMMGALPKFNSLTIRGSIMEKAGASLAQELAFSLSLFTEYLSEASERLDSASLADFVRRTEFRVGIGTNYFLEIAKLRALKLLVQNVVDTFGIQGVRPKFHAITTSTNKTLYDPYNNLLRATIEAMASTIGGVDSLSVAAYDQGYGAPDEFSEHLTRNTEALLLDESYIGKVADPLGGSYTVEKLTSDYAEVAWSLFQDIENQGGFVAAWENESIPNAIRAIQAKRSKQIGSRRRTIVGTTVYPNPKEQRLSDVKTRTSARQVSIPLVSMEQLRKAQLDFFESETMVPSTALDPFRPSWPFEHLRLRIERMKATGGKVPTILLAEFGDRKMRKARSMFVQGFLGAGGYGIREVIVADAAELSALLKTDSPAAVVLCSEDSAYLDFAKALNTEVPVIIAGNPVETIDDLKAAGVVDFIHIRLDQLDTLERYHTRFEIPGIPLNEPLIPEAK